MAVRRIVAVPLACAALLMFVGRASGQTVDGDVLLSNGGTPPPNTMTDAKLYWDGGGRTLHVEGSSRVAGALSVGGEGGHPLFGDLAVLGGATGTDGGDLSLWATPDSGGSAGAYRLRVEEDRLEIGRTGRTLSYDPTADRWGVARYTKITGSMYTGGISGMTLGMFGDITLGGTGVLCLKEYAATAPASTPGHVKLFTRRDNQLHFMDGDGADHVLLAKDRNSFGEWTPVVLGMSHWAQTDGYLVAHSSAVEANTVVRLLASSTYPAQQVRAQYQAWQAGGTTYNCATVAIRKGECYMVKCANYSGVPEHNAYWMPTAQQ
jgi:hypothetical protein